VNLLTLILKEKTMTKKTVVINKDFNENIEEIAELVVYALDKCTSIPQLSADAFIMRLGFLVRSKLETY
jgi:hypothetical protein